MKTYQKICANCGKTFIAHKSNAKTCSINCRVSLHYRKNFGNTIVLNNKDVERSTFELNNEKSISTKSVDHVEGSIYGVTTKLKRKLNVVQDSVFGNYFINDEQGIHYIQNIEYNGEIYLLTGFFCIQNSDFSSFHLERASNISDFIFIKTILEFPSEGQFEDIVDIYVNKYLFYDFYNDGNLYNKYNFVPYDVSENPLVIGDKLNDSWLFN